MPSLASTLLVLVIVVFSASAVHCDHHPYLVAISYRNRLLGAGVIINERHVLTSASTIFHQTELDNIHNGGVGWKPTKVHAGSRFWDQSPQVHKVFCSHFTEHWKGYIQNDTDSGRAYMTTVKNDWAVLKLDSSFEYNSDVQPIRMIGPDDPSPMGMLAKIPTWDSTDGRVFPARSSKSSSSKMLVYSGLRLAQARRCEICSLERYNVSLDATDGWCAYKRNDGDGRRYLDGSPVVVNGMVVGVVTGPMGVCSLESSYIVDPRPHLKVMNDFMGQGNCSTVN
ncbi:unnamed protein product [Trichogramma brassicae]|uniref:Peptidase S1 domain-containing protein n=1 Tax=Trichogramma brassicae TaxID=86971 RepID=A0A6H5IMJ9_9HYME|nr:unnamed protein product [Trichogramma brassicae]